MFNPKPSGGCLVGQTGFIFFITCIISLVVLWFEIPETKDRTFVELDKMFEQKVPTPKFKAYKPHGFGGADKTSI